MNELNSLNYIMIEDICSNINDIIYVKNLLTIMSPNHQVFRKNMAIVHYCIYSNSIDVIHEVFRSGGNPNLTDINGINATDLSVLLNKPGFFEILVSYGGKLSFCK
jgi:hypothetical protein